jgi:hypothetical protein
MAFNQACSQKGASGCNTPTADLDAPTMSLQNIKEKDAKQPAKKHAAPY